jgi:hypothetical protein
MFLRSAYWEDDIKTTIVVYSAYFVSSVAVISEEVEKTVPNIWKSSKEIVQSRRFGLVVSLSAVDYLIICQYDHDWVRPDLQIKLIRRVIRKRNLHKVKVNFDRS